jgi:hypothetical protein
MKTTLWSCDSVPVCVCTDRINMSGPDDKVTTKTLPLTFLLAGLSSTDNSEILFAGSPTDGQPHLGPDPRVLSGQDLQSTEPPYILLLSNI